MHSLLTRLVPAAARSARRAAALIAAIACLVAGAALLGPAAPAAAAPPGPHDPYGAVGAVTPVAGGVVVRGWAVDPDARMDNASVFSLVDGYGKSVVKTTVASTTIANREHTGPTPGFVLNVPVGAGVHTLCIAVSNVGAGKNTVIKCVVLPAGTTLSSAQLATHNPQGTISQATAGRSSLRVVGFTNDSDYRNKHFEVVLYVDGRSVATKGTMTTAAGAPKGSGKYASFDITVPVASGTHMACVWAVNIGLGANSFYGCRALDTRAGLPMAAGAPSTAIDAKVLAEAKKHIGQPYVWGATGPKSFDCSGLVMYSYQKNGFTTPRVSEDQAVAARLIPASRALPGDLVFYHDSTGDVYHVGIYAGPGTSVAAIDEQEGVNYQQIWDPTWATYGSFTHT